MRKPFRVGVVGANPKRGWATAAHLPALKAMNDFELAAICTTRQETADETAGKFEVPQAYGSWQAMLAEADIDIVAVCVKVAHHREIVAAAIEAGKHVFCEWPLGLTTAEAEAMRDAAEARGVRHVVGLQGRASPALNEIRSLVAGGAVGEVISTTMISSLNVWGPRLPPSEAYRTQLESGTSGLTVSGGHSLDSLCYCLGEFRQVSGIVTTQHKKVEIVGTGEVLDVTTPDQVLVSGVLEGGAVASVHIKADMASPTGVLFEINGTEGDIVAASRKPVGIAPVGIQRADLTLQIARGRKQEFVDAPVSEAYTQAPAVPEGPPFFTAQLYARLSESLTNGTPALPDFSDAVRCHRLLDAIQRASDTGETQTLWREPASGGVLG
jgi:predicted dehydrogenase